MTTEWLTPADRERIADYLSKPAHERRAEDLVPGEDGPDDRR